jgi:SAM-dependent methyltransferase
VFDSREEALRVPTGDIELAVCMSCGLVFNRIFDARLGDLGAQYESSQEASGHFGAFAKSLASDWVTRYSLSGKAVVEVGCGSGDFARQLVACGVDKVIGIDPLAGGTAASRTDQIDFIASPFNATHAGISADAIVCRHTLEHIQDVCEFLLLLRLWAEKEPHRVILVEIPDAERIFSERAFWDIYYEHCNYFTEKTARHAFNRAGLEVLDARRVYGDQYLIIEARASAAAIAMDPLTPRAKLLEDYNAFSSDVRATIACCVESIEELMLPKQPVLLWQGAAKTVGFMSVLPERTAIDGAIDLNPYRSGKFLPGSALPVHAPERLPGIAPRYVVLMNPVYLDEVREKIRALGSEATLFSINELLKPDFAQTLRANHSTTK